MKYRMYVGDVEWQKLKTALALKPSVQMGAVDKPSSNTFWYDKIKEKYGGQGYDDTIIS